MESFLDEYQLVRMGLGILGLAYIGVAALAGYWDTQLGPIVTVLVIVTGHALWCRWRRVRSPRVMLLLDLTLWGWVMGLPANKLTVATASFVILTLLVVLFADGYWIVLFLLYITGWYGYAFFSERPSDGNPIGEFGPIVLTVACVAIVIYYVRRWLGRLDANRSQMMGTVSHELRNNLTGMIGITDLLDISDDLSLEQVKELIGLANQQALDAAEIVEDLLTVSRLESSALEVSSEVVDVNSEVATVVRRFAGEGTDVSADVDAGLPPARGDSLRVRQVLRNLISNAVRYGGPAIEVTTRFVGDKIEIVVSDDGEGVPDDDKSTIFLPYRRSTVTRRHASSVGLGLWICRQLASAMGGELEYRRPDELTEFVLRLRVDTPEPSAVPTASPARRERVLVDDDRMASAAIS
jgi:signal transduction histidine kinase